MQPWWILAVVVIALLLLLVILLQRRSFYQPQTTLPAGKQDHRRIRIIHKSSYGLALDASVYAAIFSDIMAVTHVAHLLPLEVQPYMDINLHLEEIFDTDVYPAEQNWLMVNHEFLPQDLTQIDKFLCKSYIAVQVIQEVIVRDRLKGVAIYTGHVSPPMEVTMEKKQPLTFAHLAGKSWLKNTKELLQCWIANKGFREYGNTQLLLTCRERCSAGLDTLIKEAKQYGVIHYTNAPLKQVYSTASFFLCPSTVEGFGHYINEARSAYGIIVTTDSSPMSEMVFESYNGFLVDCVSDHKPPMCGIVREQLAHAIIKCCLLTPTKREEMMVNSHRFYWKDFALWQDRMLRLLH